MARPEAYQFRYAADDGKNPKGAHCVVGKRHLKTWEHRYRNSTQLFSFRGPVKFNFRKGDV